jgi:hypothetical protein
MVCFAGVSLAAVLFRVLLTWMHSKSLKCFFVNLNFLKCMVFVVDLYLVNTILVPVFQNKLSTDVFSISRFIGCCG